MGPREPPLSEREPTADGLQDSPSPAATWLSEQVGSVFGRSTLAILHYGSRAHGRATRQDSPFDFFVIVKSYREAYDAASRALGPRGRRLLGPILARLLPPNSMCISGSGPFGELEAKCLILSEPDFRRECSAHARDHFVQARVAQHMVLMWSGGTAARDTTLATVRQARGRSFEWARVFLPPVFDLSDYCRVVIGVPFVHEIRAEARGHESVLFEAQRSTMLAIYEPLLTLLVEQGVLAREGDRYRQRRPPGAVTRFRVGWWFRRSKALTTLRLLKHPFLYDDWLGYLTRKIDRSTGQKIELSRWERSWPLIFLWPRVARYLHHRPQRQR